MVYKYIFCSNCGGKFDEINKEYYVCPECSFRIFVSPKPAVGIFLFNDKNEILFLVRANDPGKGMLGIPGGFINSDESTEDALKREVFEETGLKIDNFNYFGSYFGNYLYKGINYKTVDIIYTGKINATDIKISEEEIDYKFLKIDEIDPETMGTEDIKKAVTKLIQAKHHLVQF